MALMALPIVCVVVFLSTLIIVYVRYRGEHPNASSLPLLCNAGSCRKSGAYHVYSYGLTASGTLLAAIAYIEYERATYACSSDLRPSIGAEVLNTIAAVTGGLAGLCLSLMGVISLWEADVKHNIFAISFQVVGLIYMVLISTATAWCPDAVRYLFVWRVCCVAVDVVLAVASVPLFFLTRSRSAPATPPISPSHNPFPHAPHAAYAARAAPPPAAAADGFAPMELKYPPSPTPAAHVLHDPAAPGGELSPPHIPPPPGAEASAGGPPGKGGGAEQQKRRCGGRAARVMPQDGSPQSPCGSRRGAGGVCSCKGDSVLRVWAVFQYVALTSVAVFVASFAVAFHPLRIVHHGLLAQPPSPDAPSL